MRGNIVDNYKFIRGCMRPEVDFTVYDFANAPGGDGVVTFPDIYLDNVRDMAGNLIPDGTIFHGSIQCAPGWGGVVTVQTIGLPGGDVLLRSNYPGTSWIPYGIPCVNIPMEPAGGWGSGYGFIDSITIPAEPFVTSTTFRCRKNRSGKLRKMCVRAFINFSGTHDKWAIDYLGGPAYCTFVNIPYSGYTHYHAKIVRYPFDPTHKYTVEFYDDMGNFCYGTSDLLDYGTPYTQFELQEYIGGTATNGTISINVPADPGADVLFETTVVRWTVDDQSPNPIDYFDISPYFKGSFRITGTENEAIASKSIQRKVNMTLDNTDNIFDYKVFQAAYNPLLVPPALNGPYDTEIYTQTGGATGAGKKLGNIRAGRFAVVQDGIYDDASASWIWRDKFRGRLGDPQYSRVDNTVQITLDDETAYYRKIKTETDVYINKTFEYIFADQAERRLGFTSANIVVPTTNISAPFVYMPDYGETVFDALIKLAEAVGGNIDLTEDGKIVCSSRLADGDATYLWNTGLMQDDCRTLADNTVDNVVDIQGSSILYNQQIINRVTITSKPYKISQTSEKVWKFKAFYDDTLAKNTGWLQPNHYFGDVWAQNLVCTGTTGKGPVKLISRSNLFDTTLVNKSVMMTITQVPPAAPPGFIRATFVYEGTTFANILVPADATTGYDIGAVFVALSGAWIILESAANITVGDQAELQLGIKFYADFGSSFRVMPNRGGAITPPNDYMTFAIVSSIRDSAVPANDWKLERTANSTNNTVTVPATDGRVVMALDPSISGATNYETQNIFYANSQSGDAFAKVPILIVNKDTLPRYVNSFEIFGRRIVEQSNMVVDVKATDLVIEAFGGEQLLTIDNNFISKPTDQEKLAKFIIDNYSAPRDIPQVTMKHPRPFLQVGDRVKNIDNYTGVEREFVINDIDETYTSENVQMVLKLREADAGNGAYDPTGSFSESIVINLVDYTKLETTVDTTKGATSTEVKRDIYNMRGISYHGRQFNFDTGTYSDGPGGPFLAPAAPGGIVESYAGEPRRFASTPTVLVMPLYIPKRTVGPLGAEATTGVASYAIPATLSALSFQGYCYTDGEVGIQYGWFYWVAIGETQTIT